MLKKNPKISDKNLCNMNNIQNGTFAVDVHKLFWMNIIKMKVADNE